MGDVQLRIFFENKALPFFDLEDESRQMVIGFPKGFLVLKKGGIPLFFDSGIRS